MFVVYGGRVAVMAPPSVAHRVTADGGWTAAALAESLGPKISTGSAGFSAVAALTFD
ncbi:hypothetical protein GCM10010411_38530 [Actinomadura fulvescens]|uniref:Uncharacterized protein n=1 Tax=Actinomadura fulvescens TaxID=46160 RepID=A0ABP6C8W9_9ACTN